jgi:hypothetical protein
MKTSVALALAGAITAAATTPTLARDWRPWAAAGAGFAAGAAVGAAAAHGYYGPGYYSGPGYAYEGDYYAYEPGVTYVQPAPRYRYYNRNAGACGTSTRYGTSGECIQ